MTSYSTLVVTWHNVSEYKDMVKWLAKGIVNTGESLRSLGGKRKPGLFYIRDLVCPPLWETNERLVISKIWKYVFLNKQTVTSDKCRRFMLWHKKIFTEVLIVLSTPIISGSCTLFHSLKIYFTFINFVREGW